MFGNPKSFEHYINLQNISFGDEHVLNSSNQTEQTRFVGFTQQQKRNKPLYNELFRNYKASYGSTVRSNVASATVEYQPSNGSCTLIKNGFLTNINTKQHCITAMNKYENKSLEELRFADYLLTQKVDAGLRQAAFFLGFGSHGTMKSTGTAFMKYQPLQDTYTVIKNGRLVRINIMQHCITGMKDYENKSLEELRFEDYSKILKDDCKIKRILTLDSPQSRNSSFHNLKYGVQTRKWKPFAFDRNETTKFIGTSIVKYKPLLESYTILSPSGRELLTITKTHCITAMKEYEYKSLEELRHEDYFPNRKSNAEMSVTGVCLFPPPDIKNIFGSPQDAQDFIFNRIPKEFEPDTFDKTQSIRESAFGPLNTTKSPLTQNLSPFGVPKPTNSFQFNSLISQQKKTEFPVFGQQNINGRMFNNEITSTMDRKSMPPPFTGFTNKDVKSDVSSTKPDAFNKTKSIRNNAFGNDTNTTKFQLTQNLSPFGVYKPTNTFQFNSLFSQQNKTEFPVFGQQNTNGRMFNNEITIQPNQSIFGNKDTMGFTNKDLKSGVSSTKPDAFNKTKPIRKNAFGNNTKTTKSQLTQNLSPFGVYKPTNTLQFNSLISQQDEIVFPAFDKTPNFTP